MRYLDGEEFHLSGDDAHYEVTVRDHSYDEGTLVIYTCNYAGGEVYKANYMVTDDAAAVRRLRDALTAWLNDHSEEEGALPMAEWEKALHTPWFAPGSHVVVEDIPTYFCGVTSHRLRVGGVYRVLDGAPDDHGDILVEVEDDYGVACDAFVNANKVRAASETEVFPVGSLVRLKEEGELSRGYSATPGAATAKVVGHATFMGRPSLTVEWMADHKGQWDGDYHVADFTLVNEAELVEELGRKALAELIG
jgi:hypothetical protein